MGLKVPVWVNVRVADGLHVGLRLRVQLGLGGCGVKLPVGLAVGVRVGRGE